MRKLLLISVSVFIFSCSGDDDSTSNQAECQSIYDYYQEQIDYVLSQENPDQVQVDLLREERQNRLDDAGCGDASNYD